jgi:hypothetical protein
MNGTTLIWKCLPDTLTSGKVSRLVVQDSGSVQIISDKNTLLWSSSYDTPRYVSIGHDLKPGNYIRSETGTSLLKIDEKGSFIFQCSDVYSDSVLNIT